MRGGGPADMLDIQSRLVLHFIQEFLVLLAPRWLSSALGFRVARPEASRHFERPPMLLPHILDPAIGSLWVAKSGWGHTRSSGAPRAWSGLGRLVGRKIGVAKDIRL